jgi:hypothetical protein
MTWLKITAKLQGLDDGFREAGDELRRKAFLILMKIGDMYISTSRANGTYTDRTGILRTAHSYAIYENGVTVFESIGRPETKQMFEEMKEGKGIEFMVGDGINYASFVEGKNFDVSTSGFRKVESEIRKLAIR